MLVIQCTFKVAQNSYSKKNSHSRTSEEKSSMKAIIGRANGHPVLHHTHFAVENTEQISKGVILCADQYYFYMLEVLKLSICSNLAKVHK